MFISYMHCRLRVVSEVILSNLLEVSEGIYPGFETQDKRHQESKTGHHWPHKNIYVLQIKNKRVAKLKWQFLWQSIKIYVL